MKAGTGSAASPFISSPNAASPNRLRCMSRRYRFATNLGIFLLLVAGRLTLAAQEKELTALEIFDRTLAAFDNQRVALRDWQYYQTLTTHQFDSSGAVVARGTWQSIVRPGDPRPLEYVAERMEGKLSFFKSDSSSSPTPAATASSATPALKSKPREGSEEKNQME